MVLSLQLRTTILGKNEAKVILIVALRVKKLMLDLRVNGRLNSKPRIISLKAEQFYISIGRASLKNEIK